MFRNNVHAALATISSLVRRSWGRMGKYRLRVILIAATVPPGAWVGHPNVRFFLHKRKRMV